MSAIDELRRMLDERGVKWWREAWNKDLTIFDGAHDVRYRADHTLGEWFIMSVLPITAEQVIAATLGCEVNGDTSDGYHTFDELYYHRTALFACLVSMQPRQMAFKSRKHADGTMYDGMFIAGIYTSRGWCTYHCEDRWWPLFDCSEREFAPEWDDHTPSDAIHRLMSDFLPKQEVRGEAAE